MCEAPSVFRANARRARKPARCDECRRQIEIGELYEYVWGIWEGEPGNYQTCAECWEVRDALWTMMHDGGSLYEEEIACELAYGNLPYALAEQDAAMTPLPASAGEGRG